MKADDDQPCRGLKQPGCGLKQCPNFVQLAIDVDAESLKGPGGRMNALAFHWRDDRSYDPGKVLFIKDDD